MFNKSDSTVYDASHKVNNTLIISYMLSPKIGRCSTDLSNYLGKLQCNDIKKYFAQLKALRNQLTKQNVKNKVENVCHDTLR